MRAIPFNHEEPSFAPQSTSAVGNHIINLGSLLQQSLLDPSQNVYKHVVSEEGKKQMQLEKYDANVHKETFCPITQKNFEDGQEVIILPCQHLFEPHAIQRWLQEENATCPVCRFPLQSKEVRKQSKAQDISSNSSAPPSNTSAPPITFFSAGQSRLLNNLDFINAPLRSITRRQPVSSTFQRHFVNYIIRQEIDREEEADLQQAIIASLVEMQKTEEKAEEKNENNDMPPLEEAQINIDTDVEMEDLDENDISENMDENDISENMDENDISENMDENDISEKDLYDID